MSKKIQDPAHHRKKALTISTVVYGREKIGNRVVYHVDNNDESSPKKNAEAIVLYRWKRKKDDGYIFSGSRLNPKIWRSLPLVFGDNTKKYLDLEIPLIKEHIESFKKNYPEIYVKLPASNHLYALFKVCGPERLAALIARHNSKVRIDNFGTPDLFLYSTCKSRGAIRKARFVEVKKPEEPLSQDQADEIDFLNSIGLHARVTRLDERTRKRP